MHASPRRAPAPEPRGYRRRRPENTELYEAVRQHLASFLELAGADPSQGGLPAHVRGELERYLRCGILAYGFVRVWCPTCKDDLLVAFSCRGRGVCPSCGGRRMADTAARWVDHVLPEVPFRQWVLALPFPVRFRLAWEPELLTRVLRIVHAAIGGRLRLLARRRGHRGGRHAAVTVVQRFGSSLNLNVHLHCLVADGVWVEGEGGPRFVPLRLRDEDVRAVLARIYRRVRRLLLERGLLGEEVEDPEVTEPDRQLELRLAGASVLGRTALGPRAGQPLRRVGQRRRSRSDHPRSRRRRELQDSIAGFDLHAGLRVPRNDRARLERLSRYLLRPAVCMERLSLREDGLYQYDFRRPWSDGSIGIVLEPMGLMERLAALVPIPRANLVRYHGVLAPAATWRSRVVPRRADDHGGCGHRRSEGPAAPNRLAWAELLRRVFLVDVLRCAGCGGRREIVAEVTDPDAARAILEHLGLLVDVPLPEPARGPPDRDLPRAS